MNGLPRPRGETSGLRRRSPLVLAAMLTFATASCSEKLEAGKSCPLLCPVVALELRDTVIDAVVFDTTVSGLPSIGNEDYLLLAAHGDSLDTRVVVRYDTLPRTYRFGTADSTITAVDSAHIRAIIVRDTLHKPAAPITIQLYDIDSLETDTVRTAVDTVVAHLLPFFRSDRLIGSRTFAPESLTDTLRLPIANSVVLSRLTTGRPLRVGLRLVSSQSADIAIVSAQAGTAPTLIFRGSLDTAATPVTVTPLSQSPNDKPFLAGALSDFVMVVKGSPPTPITLLSVGGVPPRRTFFRFDVPAAIVDSATIVRASLQLTQRPTPNGVNRSDSILVFPVVLAAAPTITDVFTALQFLAPAFSFGLGSMTTVPSDSGVKSIELGSLVRTWKGSTPAQNPRAVALRAGNEWLKPGEITFFSTRAAPALRPRLRITYVPPTAYGLP
jgi:hypothetical protein